jgi:hypothetical protein
MRGRLEFAAKALLLTAFAAVCAVGVFRIHERALAGERNQAELGRWTVLHKPAWCVDDDVRAVRDATALRGWRTPVADLRSGVVLERALAEAPHVRRVVAVRRELPDAYDVLLEIRRPAAAVVIPGRPERYAEVDEDGVVLAAPAASRPMRGGTALRLITGVAGGAPRPGMRYGRDVVDAASLCVELDRCAGDGDGVLLAALDVVDVANWGERKKAGESEVVLRMSGYAPPAPDGTAVALPPPSRCAVEWGRVRGREAGDLESTFGAKAERALRVLRVYPRLEGLSVVRVAFDDVAVVPQSGTARPRR